MITTSVTTFSQKIYFQLWLIRVSYFTILFWPIKNRHLNNCVLWNLLYQYNNIYTSSYKYLKKSTNWWLKKRKKDEEKRANEMMNSTYWINKKSAIATILAFTHLLTIFSQNIYFHLWLVSCIFYYFISIYKKLTFQ